MAITIMGAGTKTTPEGVNVDPQGQFWSFLNYFAKGNRSGIISGFSVTQNDPVGMSVLVGGSNQDSAILSVDNRKYLLSSDGTAQAVTIATASATADRYDAIISYLDTTGADPTKETAGTPQYVKTIAVTGGRDSAGPSSSDVQAKLPAAAQGDYIKWAVVHVAKGATQITNADIAPTNALGNSGWRTIAQNTTGYIPAGCRAYRITATFPMIPGTNRKDIHLSEVTETSYVRRIGNTSPTAIGYSEGNFNDKTVAIAQNGNLNKLAIFITLEMTTNDGYAWKLNYQSGGDGSNSFATGTSVFKIKMFRRPGTMTAVNSADGTEYAPLSFIVEGLYD